MTIIIPNVSVNGVAKTGLMESRILDAPVDIISLAKECLEHRSFTKSQSLTYVSSSEIIV